MYSGAWLSDSGITTPASEYFECTRRTQTIQITQRLSIWHGIGTLSNLVEIIIFVDLGLPILSYHAATYSFSYFRTSQTHDFNLVTILLVSLGGYQTLGPTFTHSFVICSLLV